MAISSSVMASDQAEDQVDQDVRVRAADEVGAGAEPEGAGPGERAGERGIRGAVGRAAPYGRATSGPGE